MALTILAPPSILIVRFAAIGDVVMATPLLRALRARHPQAHIAFLTERQYAPLLAESPHLDEVIAVAPDESLRALARRVPASRFSHRLDLDGSLRSRALRLLAGGKWQYVRGEGGTGAFGALGDWARFGPRLRRSSRPEFVPLAERYFEAAGDLDVRPDGLPPEICAGPEAEAEAERWLAKAGLGQGRALVVFAPGGPHEVRRWPGAHWVKLATRLAQTGADVVLVGGAEDSPFTTEIVLRSGSPHVRSAAGELSLGGSAAVLARASAVVSGDTGPLHVATGVGAPVVGLYGPTTRQSGLFPYRGTATVLERDFACRPCDARDGDPCPLGHHGCLHSITVDDVFEALCRTAR